jgi:hypothetical protein
MFYSRERKSRDITKQLQLQGQIDEERAYTRRPIEASVDGLVTWTGA